MQNLQNAIDWISLKAKYNNNKSYVLINSKSLFKNKY